MPDGTANSILRGIVIESDVFGPVVIRVGPDEYHSRTSEWVGYPTTICGECGTPWPCAVTLEATQDV